MNKSGSGGNIILNIVLALFIIIFAWFIHGIYDLGIYRENVHGREVYVKDDKYKVILEQAYEESIIPFAPYRTRVTVGKKVGDEWIYKDPFELSYKIGGAIRKENVTIDWIDGGVIIKVTGVEKEKDMTYRVYWEDVF
jgi:hypothetical protein